MKIERELRQELADIARLVYDRRLTFGSGGNISARLDQRTMLITPSGRLKGLLRPEEMIRVDIPDGRIEGDKKPSMEAPFHLAFYRTRPDVGAVIHCHPLSCTSLAVMGRRLRSTITPEGVLVLGDFVPTVDYATPGTEGLADKIVAGIGTADVCILSRHGALTVGKDLLDAFNKMETMEYIATLQLKCEELGDLEELPEEEVELIKGK
jgi:L-fuculose-phosphate aldolase